MGKKEKFLAFFGFLLGFASLARTILLTWNSNLLDFGVYYYAAQSIINHENPYLNPQLFTQASYPPITFLFITPLTLLPIDVSEKIWISLSVLCIFFSFYFLYKIKPIPYKNIICIFTLFVLSFPFKFTIAMGQINLLVLSIIILFIYFIKSKPHVAALSLSVAIALKLFPAFLLTYFTVKRNYKFIFVTITFFSLMLLLSLSSINIEFYMYYFKEIFLSTLTKSAGGIYFNQSITGLFARVNAPSFILTIVRILIVIVSIYKIAISKINFYNAVSLLISVTLLVNSFSWQHHFIFLLIPYYFLISQKISRLKSILIFISYVLISYNIKYLQLFEGILLKNIILSHVFFGALLLWLILIFERDSSEIFYTPENN